MKLQTKIPLQPQRFNQIEYASNILLFGSCFAARIGSKLEDLKFNSTSNPFGVLFHPLAIEKLITRAITKDYFTDNDLIFNNEHWCCLEVHSQFNSTSKTDILKQLNTQIDNTYNDLKLATHIILTLGTSWVYKHNTSEIHVANCHKLPQTEFKKVLLPVDTITTALQALVLKVKVINPKASFLFTVSPVRHIKDGFVENMQSKAHLVTAIHQIIANNKQIHYFPSYEIMMDELRDYRFYNADMLHPNTVAIDYIWEKFKTVWLSNNTIDTLEKVVGIQKRKTHRPFNINSEAHQKFLKKLQIDIDTLRVSYPEINF